MQRVFTMRRRCKHCACSFTINGSNHWYCGNTGCTKSRRKADREARKVPYVVPGSDEHLAHARRPQDDEAFEGMDQDAP